MKMIDGGYQLVVTKNIVGRCHYYGHPGVLTEKTMIAHNCLGKECRHFEKNEAATYWVKVVQERLKKEAEKLKKKKAKEKATEKKLKIEDLKSEFQDYADKLDYDLEIIRLEELETNAYRLFYVSDNRYADGNRFPELLSEIRCAYPRIHIQMRHIKDVDGRFVTIDEYYSRRRK